LEGKKEAEKKDDATRPTQMTERHRDQRSYNDEADRQGSRN
jgi:hypothetical protein